MRSQSPNGRFCSVCGKPLVADQKATCSREHQREANYEKHKARTPDRIEAVKALRLQGKTLDEICELTGLKSASLHRVIRDHKIPLAKPPKGQQEYISEAASNIEAVTKLRLAGEYISDICQKLGLSKYVVEKIIHDHKLPRTSVPRVPVQMQRQAHHEQKVVDRRTKLPLREVFRLASDYQINRSRYGDDWEKLTAAISRAMQREDPSYPGIALMPSRFVGQSQITSKVWV